MSAIFGILRYDGGAVSARDLERVGNTLQHRGPDGRKFVIDGPVGFGHCLMRVNREDSFEAQPIYDRAPGLILAADCRIDNREELADAFNIDAGALARLPDSALVLQAYKVWGEACAEHLVGDFAFAVWDAQAGKLLLGRDHMGQRNIFYHQAENFFAFASEIKGLWAVADVPRQLLDQEIARVFYKTGIQSPEGRTLYAGIRAIPGGTIVTAGQDRTLTCTRYWQPHADPTHENREESYYIEKYRSVLAEAVACRLRRLAGPAALLNSAGFDTGAIAGLAGPIVEAQGRKLISLSWLGEESVLTTRGDLRPWLEACRRVMPHLDIREVSRKSENPLHGIERVYLAHDGPGIGSGRTSGHLFTEAAGAGARLIMDGYGGDYTLNPRGYGALARHLRQRQLRRFFSELRARLRLTERSAWRVVKHEVVLMLLPWSVIRWQRALRRIGAHARVTAARRELAGPYLEELQERNASDANPGLESIPMTAMRACMLHVVNSMCRASAAGKAIPAAAHGLDLTRPFHDKRVVELGLAVPEELYMKNGLNRYLARRALADIYPPEFQTRGHSNEGALGDSTFLDMSAPELAAEAGRLAKSAKFSAYFDFERAGQILGEPDRDGETAQKAVALRALLSGRFMEWFGSSNAQ